VLVETVLTNAVRSGTSILFPTMGEVISERSGVINLGTEGCMLAGALTAYVVGIESGNAYLGLLAGIGAGAVLALVHAFFVLSRGANQIATGLAVTFLGIGVTSLLGQSYVGQGVNAIDPWAIPGLSDVPFLGDVLFDHDPVTYLAFVAAPALWWLVFRTRTGMKLRAAGERPEVLEVYGTSPTVVRYVAVVAGGGLAGLGGAQLSTIFTRTWSENMTVGYGFVAVALAIFAAWSPVKAVAGAYLFSGSMSLAAEAQARGWDVSPYLLQAMPYLVVVVVLCAISTRRVYAGPEALTRVFEGAA
jgi:general nucleoside transport system permease protein